jgi:hypothetical protein
LQRKAFNDIKRVAFSLGLSYIPEGDNEASNTAWDAINYKPILRDEEYKNKPSWNEVDFKKHMVKKNIVNESDRFVACVRLNLIIFHTLSLLNGKHTKGTNYWE